MSSSTCAHRKICLFRNLEKDEGCFVVPIEIFISFRCCAIRMRLAGDRIKTDLDRSFGVSLLGNQRLSLDDDSARLILDFNLQRSANHIN